MTQLPNPFLNSVPASPLFGTDTAGVSPPPDASAGTISESALASAMTARPRKAFTDQKHKAKRRGIAWEFTFEQWWSVWQRSGKWNERGRGQGYVMCRNADAGAYSMGNVFIAPSRENASVHPNKKKTLPMGVSLKPSGSFEARRKLYGKRVHLGTYANAEEAHAAYLAAGGATP